MNRLIIIGNGFDLAHGLKTSYMDFINWYWDRIVESFYNNYTSVYEDKLCKIKINVKEGRCDSWNQIAVNNKFRDKFTHKLLVSGYEVILSIIDNTNEFNVNFSLLFGRIFNSIEKKGWVDIENDYYTLLKENIDNPDVCKEINEQMDFLKEKLVEYLKSQNNVERNSNILDLITDKVNKDDVSQEGIRKMSKDASIYSGDDARYRFEDNFYLRDTLFLDFNYTDTTKLYSNNEKCTINHIHGTLTDIDHVIFGYGDELDNDYDKIKNNNNQELLKNSKSVKYLETSKYRDLLRFIGSDYFQVYIMGHSCGLSDRTLLNTIFEHENCVSIKPFYHEWTNDKGVKHDNYSEITQNIYRNFKDMKLFRDRVVSKDRCRTI